jgi:hypothetical protein
VRLDHLLSKEHLAGERKLSRSRPTLETFALGVELKGGTLTSRPSPHATPLVQPVRRWERDERRSTAQARCWVLKERAVRLGARTDLSVTRTSGRASSDVRCGGSVTDGPVHVGPLRTPFVGGSGQATSRDRDRPYLENCTVDASIFVAKLVRAHGGCLGTRSR